MHISQAFDYNRLSTDTRKAVHDELAATTMKHIAAHEELFEPLPFDPIAHPSQQLERVQLSPSPTTRDEIETLASIAAPTLFAVIKSALARQTTVRDAARDILARGEHLFPVTTHATIADVAIWSAAWSEYLEQDDPKQWQDHNGLIISRGVTTIGVFGMAGSEIMQKGGHVFMSFPRTQTIAKLNLPADLISTNNASMLQKLNDWLDCRILAPEPRGKNLAIAWSGKTDHIEYGDDHQPRRITLGALNNRTAGLVQRGWILPIVTWVDDSRQEAVLGEITKADSTETAQHIQRWQGDTLAHILGLPTSAVAIE